MSQAGLATIAAGELRTNFYYADNNQSKMLVILKAPDIDPLLLFTRASPSFTIDVQGSIADIAGQLRTKLSEIVRSDDVEFSPIVMINNPERGRHPAYQLVTNGSMTAEQLVDRLESALSVSKNQEAFSAVPKAPDVKLVR